MALEMKQTQRLVQELRMTPQLQQAIKLLQLSRIELTELIRDEMVENPMLEEAGDEREGPVAAAEAATKVDEAAPNEKPGDEPNAEQVVNDIDWERYLENYSSPVPGGSGVGYNEDLPSYEQTIAQKEGLTEHLLWQLGMVDPLTDKERVLAELIIGNLDDEGYLRDVTLEGMAEREDVTLDDMEDALTLVQEFDPVGVAARDLSECLVLQARHFHPENVLLRRLVQDHIPDLERKNYSGIARALDVSKDDVINLHRLVTTLDPKPGHEYSSDEPRYITPDIYIVKRDGEWVPVLNEDGMPRLRVSDYYRRALKDSDGKEAKNYVQERLRSAWWLIRSIQQRQRTIVKVTESIIRFQHDFFDKGIAHLRPLVLREVADDIGMHESTISRVTTNKYVHTPRGIFELKFFFNSSIKKVHGDDIAAESVKHRIKELIAEEPPTKPFSDQKLVNLLKERFDIDIARRTVAKYREMLGILSSSKRKSFI